TSAISDAVRRKSIAPIMPSTCFGLRAPTIAPVTAGWRSVQAMATLVSIAFYQRWNLGQVQARGRKGLGHRRLGAWPYHRYRLEAYATLISRLRRSKARDSQSRMLNEF